MPRLGCRDYVLTGCSFTTETRLRMRKTSIRIADDGEERRDHVHMKRIIGKVENALIYRVSTLLAQIRTSRRDWSLVSSSIAFPTRYHMSSAVASNQTIMRLIPPSHNASMVFNISSVQRHRLRASEKSFANDQGTTSSNSAKGPGQNQGKITRRA
jgi:hypothetical protein